MKLSSSNNTEKFLHLPGQSSQDKIRELEFQIFAYFFAILIFGAFAIAEWIRWFLSTPPQPIIWTSMGLVVIAFSIYKMKRLSTEKRKWVQGRQGEIEVGQLLEELRKNDYVIFHDIVAGGFNVDHVVISPNGIFAVETKKWSKTSDYKIVFNGEQVFITGHKPNQEPVEQARANARWIHDQLKDSTGKSFQVKPVVVFPGWWVDSTKENTDVVGIEPQAATCENRARTKGTWTGRYAFNRLFSVSLYQERIIPPA